MKIRFMIAAFETLKKWFAPRQTPAFIASQLRRPHGAFAHTIAQRMNESNRRMYQLVWEKMDLEDGDHVLEIGFGNGHFFDQLANKAKGLHLYGLDFSRAMVKAATRSNLPLIRQGRLHLAKGSSDQLPYADAFFDAICCLNVIYFWTTPVDHLQEIWRVLKPGARLYVGIRPKAILEQLPFAAYGFQLRDTETIQSIFAQSGFALVGNFIDQEPAITLYGHTYSMEGQCLVFEKIT